MHQRFKICFALVDGEARSVPQSPWALPNPFQISKIYVLSIMILLRGIQARALDLLYVHGGCRYNMLSEYQTLRQAPQIYIYFYLYRSCRNRTRQGRQRRPGNIVYGPLYVNSCSIGMVSDRFCALLLLCSAARCSLAFSRPSPHAANR